MITIKSENLTRKFADLTALDRLNLEVEEGEIFGLVGPDGAGKSTTMRLLTGILEPTEGQAWVYEKHTVKEAEPLKEHIAYMSQRFGLYEELTVLENINFYADVYGVSNEARPAAIERLLGFSGLLPFKERLAGRLSGGMKQKLGLACALIHTPRVLFLDEPTNGVDPVSRRDFWNILYDLLKEKVTIFCSTCYLDEAERCRRVGLMHKGRLLRCDPPEKIKEEYKTKTLEEAFIRIINKYEEKTLNPKH
jgi:ABC-2 type transport system ATP-binding protein